MLLQGCCQVHHCHKAGHHLRQPLACAPRPISVGIDQKAGWDILQSPACSRLLGGKLLLACAVPPTSLSIGLTVGWGTLQTLAEPTHT